MRVYSPAFEDKATIPVTYVMPGAGGDNISLPYVWEDLPAETTSLALALIDPHPVANNWIHWLVINIPASTTSLPEGASGSAMPQGCRELNNSFGKPGYGGPQPPAGTGEHPYVATLYALNVEALDLAPNATLDQFYRAIEGKVLDQAEYTGVFEQ